MWETWIEFLARGFGLAQFSTMAGFWGHEPGDEGLSSSFNRASKNCQMGIAIMVGAKDYLYLKGCL